ncbi:MAG TPA: tetratricopeptide repeat protein [Bacteroidales bacterium]|nr:tetratricopeptide repeat protein [Bacteroidales bacterium]
MKMKRNIQPAKVSKVDKAIFFIISGIWIAILVFGIITLLQPEWLKSISVDGRRTESNHYMELGNVEMYKGNMLGAISNYQQAFMVDTSNYEALGNLGIAFTYNGQYSEALSSFEKLRIKLKQDYRLEIFYQNMGDLYERMNRPDSAFYYYYKAVETGITSPYVYRKAGLFASKLDNDSLAIVMIEKSAELIKSLEYYYEEAVFVGYQEAIRKNDTVNIKVFGRFLSEVGNVENMSRYDSEILTYWLTESKDLGFAYLYLAQIAAKNGRYEEASKYANLCQKYYPSLTPELQKLFPKP